LSLVDETTLLVLAVVFLATLVRSALGFGEALVGVPLLAFIMPVEQAVPLMVLVSVVVAAVVLLQDWRHVHITTASWLLVWTLFGIPCGLLLLTAGDERVVKAILGAIIVGFSSYALASRSKLELKTDRLAGVFGFAAGVLGGAYGMNGPPLVIYGTLRRWSAAQFRATLQGYFLPASVVALVGYALAGLWVREVTLYFLFSLPVALAATLLGQVAHRRLSGRAFVVWVHALLIAVGVALWAQCIWG